MAVLQDVKDDGTSYDRNQPKPVLAPVRPTGQPTPMYGQPQAPAPPPAIAPLNGPMVNAQAPGTQRNPALPPKPGAATLPEDVAQPGSSSPSGGQPPAKPMIPPPPPPVGSVGGPMVNPGAPGTVTPPPPAGGPNIMPPPPGQGSTPATTGASANIAPIVAGGSTDLRYQMITGNDPRLGGTQGQVDRAAGDVANGPDRQALAAQAFQLLREQGEPAYQQEVRQVGQNAAKFGRIGAGMTTNDLTGLAASRERDLSQAARGLSLDAAGQTMSDRFGRLSALSGLEGQQYGQGLTSRDELRGERGYQNQTDQQARENEANRLMLEDQLLNSSFGRDQARAGLDAQIGFGQDPTGSLENQGSYYGQQANASGAGASDLLNLWAQTQANPAGATPGIVPPAPNAQRPPVPPVPPPTQPYYPGM